MRWLAALVLAAIGSAPRSAAAIEPRQGHPEPRVIVDVIDVKGPHDRDAIQRDARRLLWGKIVACYKPAVQKQPKLRGEAVYTFRAGSHGEVSGVRKVRATLKDAEVVACWAKHVRALSVPGARRASDVVMQIHVAPGDPPPVEPGYE